MSIVTMSAKSQITIPRDLRCLLNIQPGQKFKARIRKGRIELIPERPMAVSRGFLAGLVIETEREIDRV